MSFRRFWREVMALMGIVWVKQRRVSVFDRGGSVSGTEAKKGNVIVCKWIRGGTIR